MSSFQSLFNESNLSINLVVAVDNISIDYNSTGQLEIKDGGVSTNKIANLAVTDAKIQSMDASKLTGTITIPIDNTSIQTDTILVSYGSITGPSIAFKLEPTTGIYHSDVGEISFTSSGTAVIKINGLGLSVLGELNTTLDTTVGGALHVLNTAQFDTGTYNEDGSVASPAYSFTSSQDLGLYKNAASTMSIASAGVEVARFNFSSNQMFVPLALGSNSLGCGTATVTALILNSGLASSFVYLNASKNLTSIAASDGQLLIGSSTGNPSAATLTGTTNQVNVTNASNSITLSLPQNIHTAATPTFAGGFFTGTTVVGNTSTSTLGGSKLQLYGTDSNANGPHICFFTNADIYPCMQILPYSHNNVYISFDAYYDGSWRSSNPTSNFQLVKQNNVFSINFYPGSTQGSIITPLSTNKALTVSPSGQVGLPILSSYSVLYLDISKNIIGSALSNGQLLIGRSGTTPIAATLTGTTNQINITNASGSITLSTPQNIHTAATPTFAGAFLNGTTVIGASSAIGTGINKLQIIGTDNSASGPHIQTFTSADNYPLFQIQSQQHNNIVLGFDTYFDGTSYVSSNLSSNFQIGKVTNQLKVLYGSGTAQGSVPSLSVASYWDISGNFNCTNTINSAQIACSAQPCLMMSASTYISVSTATDTQFSGFDTTDYTSGSIGFSGGIATVPSLGTYLICSEMTYDATAVGTGNYDELWILKNGTIIYGRQRAPISSSNTMYLTTSATIRLAANDTIQIYVRQNSGANLHCGTITGSTARLEITKLH